MRPSLTTGQGELRNTVLRCSWLPRMDVNRMAFEEGIIRMLSVACKSRPPPNSLDIKECHSHPIGNSEVDRFPRWD